LVFSRHGEGFISDACEAVEKGHGRIVTRRVRTSDALAGYSSFPGLKQVIEVTRQRISTKTGEVTHEVEYGITNLGPEEADAKTLMGLMRGHWSIENRNNHVRDDSWREDRQVYRRGSGAYAMSVLLSMALNTLRAPSRYWQKTEPLTARAETLRDLTLSPRFVLRRAS
jgi:hypothetical protein